MSAFDELNRAWGEIQVNEAEEHFQVQRRFALGILATIPSGTADEDLTPKQRRAWELYEEADAALRTEAEQE